MPAKLNGGEPRAVPSSINPAVKNVAALSRVANDGREISRASCTRGCCGISVVAPTSMRFVISTAGVVHSYNGTSNLPGSWRGNSPVVSSREQSGCGPSLSYLLLCDFIEIRHGVKLALHHRESTTGTKSFIPPGVASTCPPLAGTDAFARFKR